MLVLDEKSRNTEVGNSNDAVWVAAIRWLTPNRARPGLELGGDRGRRAASNCYKDQQKAANSFLHPPAFANTLASASFQVQTPHQFLKSRISAYSIV